MIPREIIEEVRNRSDIEQVIGACVTLKRAGSNVKGLCPFHNEKTPSFTVYPGSQSFYCFGCGSGGDVITFVMKYNNLDYAGAVEYLAARAGIDIQKDNTRQERGVSRKRVLDMNLCAAKYFRQQLFSPDGSVALKYLTENRRLSLATIKHFGLGFAPNNTFAMLQYMRDHGFKDEELQAGYLENVNSDTHKKYSIFRNRIIFPIIDTSGSVIAFGGRVMDNSKPKYLNTNDTPAYKKGRNIFALNYAKDSGGEQMILCEGYMDVIALHAAGFSNAVAGLGTALTQDQARLLSRYTKKVVITYDSDEAGQRATERAMQLLTNAGLEVRVLVVNGAKDPDEYIKSFGATAFARLIDDSRTKFSHRASGILAKHDINDPSEKIIAAREICEIISVIPSSVERDICLDEASILLNIPKDILNQDVKRINRKNSKTKVEQQSREAYSSAKGFGDKVNPEYAKNVGAAVAEETILGLLTAFSEHRDAVESCKVELTANDFITTFGKRVFEAVMSLHTEEGGFDIALLGQTFNTDEIGRIHKMMRTRLDLTENGNNVLVASIETLKNAKELQEAKKSGDKMAAIESRLEQLRKLKNKKDT